MKYFRLIVLASVKEVDRKQQSNSYKQFNNNHFDYKGHRVELIQYDFDTNQKY